MVGTIKQQLYIKAIPEGMTMTITALNLLPPDPPEEWRATLYDHYGREAVKAPFEFDPTVNGGHLGEVKMYGTHPFPSDSLGARLEILWELTGTPTLNAEGNAGLQTSANDATEHPAAKSEEAGKDAPKLGDLPSLPPPTSQNARTGRFIVETTKWGYIQRPDYAMVLYQVGSKTPERVVSGVDATIISMPEDALFVIGIAKDKEGNENIGINGTQEKDVVNDLISHLLQGVFYVHKEAFGWVTGNFW